MSICGRASPLALGTLPGQRTAPVPISRTGRHQDAAPGAGRPRRSAINTPFRTIPEVGARHTGDSSRQRQNRDPRIDLRPGVWTDADRDSHLQAANLDRGPAGGSARGQMADAPLHIGNPTSLTKAILTAPAVPSPAGQRDQHLACGTQRARPALGISRSDFLLEETSCPEQLICTSMERMRDASEWRLLRGDRIGPMASCDEATGSARIRGADRGLGAAAIRTVPDATPATGADHSKPRARSAGQAAGAACCMRTAQA